ncbi:Non-specific serine/threonine protein kinase [Bertholletia excelsa]
MGVKLVFSAIFLLETVFLAAKAEPVEDKQALLDFVQNVVHSRPLNWNASSSACKSWKGVICNHDESRVIAVRLPGFGFRGPIPPNTLGRLSSLQILSLRSNFISEPLPSDFSQLGNLNSLYLQFNNFSGNLPADFSIWNSLSIINLSNNRFNGSIPPSLSNLTHLTALNLANNSLSGEIPDLNAPSLQVLDLSNNNLTGIIPPSLQRFPASAFSGNNLSQENPPPPPAILLPPSSKKSSKLSEPAVLGIIIGGCALGFVVLALLLVVYYTKKEGENGKNGASEKLQKKDPAGKSISQDGQERLVFFEGCSVVFDLEDLLRASAEVLGKGTFGTTYKAALEDGVMVAVKRLKEAAVAEREFEQQMRVVGDIRHENVAAPLAFCFKDEKLVLYEYYSPGSVNDMLHARRGRNQASLDWDTRLKIATGAARGLAYIHSQKLVHGNIKSSNVFLNSQQYGCVSELGLATLMSPVAPVVTRTRGYRAPEVIDTRKASQPSDVYSFGVFLLELLTGKSPVHPGGEEAVHLVRWVNSVVREEWTAEVFDPELLKYPSIEEEMVEMLQIGLACASRVPDQRPKMSDLVKRIEDVRRANTEKSEGSTPSLTPPAAESGSPSFRH